ncbi:DUF3426 domain-containing protein [Pseudarthrobacter sp. NIBRBAC000502772]|uniref:DUF3426 domain-containing protein n=1 Tax=Pseudarthrobacter sp. NIBRBAC000502772 TaxID=2590775 RepID=UPI001131F4DD|nr:DUF3426 domain-containing protein [Pseudarthrobacter sp. NIBRBAC000502772]QDG66684.1 DUF3426 domain-containing protein [Pseudarthrobacter sp. NIBRBAC000502772]
MTTDVERSIADLVAAGLIEPGTPPGSVADLVISHARSLEGIERLTGLKTLSLIGCSVGDYSSLARLRALRVLAVENSDLADADWAAGLELQIAVVRRNRLHSALPLVSLPTLQVLDLSGNPLDRETRYAAASGINRRLVTFDDADTAEINMSLADAGIGIVGYQVGADLWACATGLELTPQPEAGHVLTSHEELTNVARGAISPGRLLGLAPDDGTEEGT